MSLLTFSRDFFVPLFSLDRVSPTSFPCPFLLYFLLVFLLFSPYFWLLVLIILVFFPPTVLLSLFLPSEPTLPRSQSTSDS